MTNHYPPEYWLARSAEALAAAGQFEDPECKRVMLGIAAGYEQLAKAAERRQCYEGVMSPLLPSEPALP
ncbi:MAG: hypothetical protein ACRET5_10340 [Steroidobacteraceae bacterium]